MRDGDKRRKNTQTNPHNAMGKGMTKEQEAQQAQTIAEIREFQQLRRELGKLTVAAQNIDKLLEIVDSQAQKIADLKADKMSTDNKPDYKCLQCGWQGSYLGLAHVTVCGGEPGCCIETECPECGSSWPVPYDDVITEANP